MTDACFSRMHSVQGTKNATCCLLALALETHPGSLGTNYYKIKI